MEKIIWIGSLLVILLLLAACNNASEDPASGEAISMEEIIGIWEGSIRVPNQPLPVIVEFENVAAH